MDQGSRRRKIVILLWVYVPSLLCLGLLIAYPFAKDALAKQQQETTRQRLKQIGVALYAYHEDYGRFPPAVVLGPDGEPWHGWRVLLLPYLGEGEVAKKYRFGEPWDGPNNRKLAENCPSVFVLPTSETIPGSANACAVIGRQTMWPAQESIRIRDIKRGTTNTVALVEMSGARKWTNPRDTLVSEFVRKHRSEGRLRAMLMADGAARFVDSVDREVLANLLTPNGKNLTFRGGDWPAFLERAGRGASEGADLADSSGYGHTVVHASWREKLQTELNNHWCAVFQLAWDELKKKANGDVQTSQRVRLVDHLNQSAFDRANLVSGSYEILSGSADPQSTRAMQSDIRERFPELDFELEPVESSIASLRIFAALEKMVQYIDELDRFDVPLRFDSGENPTDVESFGSDHSGIRMGDPILTDTVRVGDYVSDGEFIIVLQTDGGRRDEVILARIPPEGTFEETWETVFKRLATPHRHRVYESIRKGELLQVPILDFHFHHRFSDLVGAEITNSALAGTSIIGEAREMVRFRLDEFGVELLAAAEIQLVGSFGDEEPKFDPKRPRRFVFDSPFLVAAREKDATQPYFMSWVAHPEIMELFESRDE